MSAIVLRKAEWERNGAGGILPVPETWTRFREAPEILALISCPRCKAPNALLGGKHAISRDACKVTPYFECAHCRYRPESLHLDSFFDKPLYAIAIERFDRESQAWIAEIHHCHARDEREARFHLGRGDYRIVAVAPAIGYHVADEHGERLIA